MATALRISDAPDATFERTRSGSTEPNPFAEAMADSRARDVAKSVKLPVDAVNEHVNLIRRAAADADHGVNITYDHTVEDYEAKGRDGQPKVGKRWVPTPDERGNVKVVFKAKDKRKSKTAENLTEASNAELPA